MSEKVDLDAVMAALTMIQWNLEENKPVKAYQKVMDLIEYLKL